jgi:hypothetical protein
VELGLDVDVREMGDAEDALALGAGESPPLLAARARGEEDKAAAAAASVVMRRASRREI